MTARIGAVSLPELVLTLLLFGFVMAGAGEFLVRSSGLARAQRDELRFMELARSARVILRGDLRVLAPADVAAATADSVRFRAFRGGGPVCGGTGDDIWVRYQGSRAPDPAKDSVLLITGPGTEAVRGLRSVSGAPCASGLAFRLTETVEDAVYALLFETGAYHLSDGALRYRRGAGGRQPLTESLLVRPAFDMRSPLHLRIDLLPGRDSLRSASPRVRALELLGLNVSPSP